MSRSTRASSTEIRYVEGRQVVISRPENSVNLRVVLSDEYCVRHATVKRIFPLSNSSNFLSVQDGEGKEVCVLRSLDGMDSASRNVLDEELDRRYYTPRITRISVVSQEAGMWRFEVDTARGPRKFFVRNWRDSAYEITPGRWHITSVDGARFEILNLSEMDERSQQLMDQLL